MSAVNDLIARLGPTQAARASLSIAGRRRRQRLRRASRSPYPNFTNPRDPDVAQRRAGAAPVSAVRHDQHDQTAAATRPAVRMYHAGVVKLTQRLTERAPVPGQLHVLEADDRMPTAFSGSGGSMDTAQPELEYSDRPARPAAHHQAEHGLRRCRSAQDRRWLQQRVSLSHVLGGWRVAAVQSYSAAGCRSASRPARRRSTIFNGTNRPNVTGADWRAPTAGDEFNPLVDRYLESCGVRRSRSAQLGNAPRINGDVRRPWNMTENMSVAKTDLDDQRAATGRPHRGVQPVQSSHLGRSANTDFTNNNFGLININGEFAAADATSDPKFSRHSHRLSLTGFCPCANVSAKSPAILVEAS